MYSFSRAEQETSILWDAETRTASIYAADPVTIRKLDKLSAEYPDTYRLISTDSLYNAKQYEVPAKYIRFGKPASAAQREMGKRLARDLSRETTGNTCVSGSESC